MGFLRRRSDKPAKTRCVYMACEHSRDPENRELIHERDRAAQAADREPGRKRALELRLEEEILILQLEYERGDIDVSELENRIEAEAEYWSRRTVAPGLMA